MNFVYFNYNDNDNDMLICYLYKDAQILSVKENTNFI